MEYTIVKPISVSIVLIVLPLRGRLKPLFHSSQKPTRKLAASAFKYCDWMKVLAASLRVGFGDEWKRAFREVVV